VFRVLRPQAVDYAMTFGQLGPKLTNLHIFLPQLLEAFGGLPQGARVLSGGFAPCVT
jgi:hypothetical protein